MRRVGAGGGKANADLPGYPKATIGSLPSHPMSEATVGDSVGGTEKRLSINLKKQPEKNKTNWILRFFGYFRGNFYGTYYEKNSRKAL